MWPVLLLCVYQSLTESFVARAASGQRGTENHSKKRERERVNTSCGRREEIHTPDTVVLCPNNWDKAFNCHHHTNTYVCAALALPLCKNGVYTPNTRELQNKQTNSHLGSGKQLRVAAKGGYRRWRATRGIAQVLVEPLLVLCGQIDLTVAQPSGKGEGGGCSDHV